MKYFRSLSSAWVLIDTMVSGLEVPVDGFKYWAWEREHLDYLRNYSHLPTVFLIHRPVQASAALRVGSPVRNSPGQRQPALAQASAGLPRAAGISVVGSCRVTYFTTSNPHCVHNHLLPNARHSLPLYILLYLPGFQCPSWLLLGLLLFGRSS